MNKNEKSHSMTTPLVSVIIPVYNREALLSQTLDSILQQTYSYFEIILINDGLTDNTLQIIKEYQKKDPRIRCITQPNKGPSAARNSGVASAKGEYICFIDSDDLMVPERIEIQVQTLLKKTADIVHSAIFFIDKKGSVFGRLEGPDCPSDALYAYSLLFESIPAFVTLMGKRSCFLQEPFNESLRLMEDYECMLRLSQKFRFKYIKKPLVLYRRHCHNLSSDITGTFRLLKGMLDQCSPEHIEESVERTSLPREEKELLKGKLLFKKGLFQQALSKLETLSSPFASFHEGNCNLCLGNVDKASLSFEKSLHETSTILPACYNNLGVAYALQNNLQEAERSFKKATELKEEYLDATFNLESILKGETTSLKITLKEFRTKLHTFLPLADFRNKLFSEDERAEL